jgi:hypothetical protein
MDTSHPTQPRHVYMPCGRKTLTGLPERRNPNKVQSESLSVVGLVGERRDDQLRGLVFLTMNHCRGENGEFRHQLLSVACNLGVAKTSGRRHGLRRSSPGPDNRGAAIDATGQSVRGQYQ